VDRRIRDEKLEFYQLMLSGDYSTQDKRIIKLLIDCLFVADEPVAGQHDALAPAASVEIKGKARPSLDDRAESQGGERHSSAAIPGPFDLDQARAARQRRTVAEPAPARVFARG
jgi:hypothetical protein